MPQVISVLKYKWKNITIENYAVMEFTERGVNLMQVSANNISNAAAYQQPFPKITFEDNRNFFLMHCRLYDGLYESSFSSNERKKKRITEPGS